MREKYFLLFSIIFSLAFIPFVSSISQESSVLSMEEIVRTKAYSENIKIYPSEAQIGSKIVLSARMNVPIFVKSNLFYSLGKNVC